ncbi:MAG: TATA-box-binding protein, partial [Euryarchaeota archaeon]|nr:TATA-box-binding protein [Euryarchaeota archaeon]
VEQLGFDDVEYNPESFIGLVYRVPEFNATFMIFSSGKVNIMGTKKLEDARLALDKLKKMLNII